VRAACRWSRGHDQRADFADTGAGNGLTTRGSPSGQRATVFINYLTGDYSFAWRTGEAPARVSKSHVTYEWIETDPLHPCLDRGVTKATCTVAFLDRNANGKWDVGEPCGALQDAPVASSGAMSRT